MESFLTAVAMRAIEAASNRPLPTDDALAALELHGSVCEISAGAGVWSGLLRKRGLVHCVCYDSAPPAHALTHVLPGGPNMASHHTDRTLLLVRGVDPADQCTALTAFVEAGGTVVAHVGRKTALDRQRTSGAEMQLATMLADGFELQVTVDLPSSGDRLTFWQKASPPAAHSGAADLPAPTKCGVLDVRLELVDMEAPDWANPPKPPSGPFQPEIGGRTIRPTMSAEAMRAEFEASLPDGFT